MTIEKDDQLKVTNLAEMKRSLFRHPDYWSGMIGQGRIIQRTHDLYSFGMVLLEIFTRRLPYFEKAEQLGGIPKLYKSLCHEHKMPGEGY